MSDVRYREAYEAAAAQIPSDEPLPSFEKMIESLQALLDADGHDEGVRQLLAFQNFEAFFTWFDIVTAFDQMDIDQSAEDHKPLLQIAFDALVDQYQAEAEQTYQPDPPPAYSL